MKRQCSALLLLGACLLLAVTPGWTLAQAGGTGGTGGGGGGGGGGAGGGGSGGIGSGGGIGTSSGVGTGTSSAAKIKPSTGGGSSTSAVPASSDFFGPYMANPLSRGLASSYYPNTGTFGTPNTATPIFGKPLYTATTNISSSGANTSTSNAGAGFTSAGILRAPPYTTVLNDDLPLKAHDSLQLRAGIQAVIDRSRYLTMKENIDIGVNGSTVILRGQVPNEKERRIVEGMVRMTPGVVNVQNELQVGILRK